MFKFNNVFVFYIYPGFNTFEHWFIEIILLGIYSNLDPLTETYGLSFYMQYLAHWPEYFQVAESPSGEIMGYSE